jgi:hypothetical protein
VLAFEREVVAALTGASGADRRVAVARWVDLSLRDMPEYLRAGVAIESLLLGALGGRRRPDAVIDWLGRTRLGPLRQYHRLFRSLVVFGELELMPPGGSTGRGGATA